MATITGSVDRVVFRNSETGFCVARFQITQGVAASTIVGTMPDVRTGEMLRLIGDWQVHPVHGRNFRVELFEPEMPSTIDGIKRYLASGIIRGVGTMTATRIVDCFGERAIEIIDEAPELLRQVAGISVKRLEVITGSWQEQKKVRSLMMFLQQYGVSVALAARIRKAYGDEAVRIISEDPYQLAHDIHGVGFRTADAVAGQLGISKKSLSRYVAGLRFTLSQATEEGHVYLPHDLLLRRAAKIVDAAQEELEPALLELLRRGDAVVDGASVYLAPFFTAESISAELVRRLETTASGLTLNPKFDATSAVRDAAARQGLSLAPKQVEAAEMALSHKISILTGGPGTGKTSTLRTIITALDTHEITYCLCAPTGRAAKRVTEATGRRASTIHRLLEFQPHTGSFNFDQHFPLPHDFVIVDEVSMLDLLLFYHLLKAVPPESHLLLVGDVDQLPAVGPGNVLQDLIASECIPSIILTDLFRQAQDSQIVVAAHAVRSGRVPAIANSTDQDLFFVQAPNESATLEAIKLLVSERIPRKFGLDPVEDVQVLSPMHGGLTGVLSLNQELQLLLNPPRSETPDLQRGGRILRLGDKVMQVRNNYEKEIFNGDIGRIVAVDVEEQAIAVAFPSGAGHEELIYESSELEELVLAYATSVHKAQGSEAPCVVIPLLTRHYVLLQRNLLYTAITRAKHLCVMVGSPKALETAVRTDTRERRFTGLTRRLIHKDCEAMQPELA